ncbi:MAG: hypothetical protein AAGH15_25540 [Myxococcota bacterium]
MTATAVPYLEAQPLDETLLQGARNALGAGLGLEAGDRFVLLAQRGHEPIGRALLEASQELRLDLQAYLFEAEQAESAALTTRLEQQLLDAQGSVLVGGFELPMGFRRRVVRTRRERRHGHMIGTTEAMMRQAMRVDMGEVHALGDRLIARLQPARRLFVTSGAREPLRCEVAGVRWHNESGRLRARGSTNLPAGEVVCSPTSVTGRLRAAGGVHLPGGEIFGRDGRLELVFRGGRLVDAEGPDGERVLAAARRVAEGDRVGQLAFGTNVGVLTPIGSVLQDMKMPGCNLVLGYTAPEHTGAPWSCTQMIPVLCRRPDVRSEQGALLTGGRYVDALFA